VISQGIKDSIFTKVYARMAGEELIPTATPKALAKPELDEGNHLSYALQWIMFALMAVAALIWGIKKEREARGISKPTFKKRKVIGQVDAEVEDSLS
jgi:cytochrome oxidase assembly protein ShyY1